MVISNLKIGTSYFFTPLKEFAKENIRYLSSIERRAAALENLQKYRGRIPAGMDYKKELAEARLEKIQKIFAEDKGWASEQEMISDLAMFRRSRKKG